MSTSTPRIYLDARNITENPAGVARYAMSLIPKLVELRPDWDWVVIRHSSNQEPLGVPGIRETFIDCPIDNAKNLLLGGAPLKKEFAKFGKPDLFHDLFHVLPRGLADDLKIVVTLHDLVWIDYAFESQPTWFKATTIREFAKQAIPFALSRADHVICVSKPTEDRAQEYLQNTPSSVVVHGVEERYFEGVPEPDAFVEKLNDGAGYVVAVGNDKPYKNLSTLLRAFAKSLSTNPGMKLALIGSCAGLTPLIQELGIEASVERPGFLDDVDLRRVVGNARLFVFPSLVEGFGLPTLEAMALGVACAVSELEPMSFVAGDAALKFDPLDAQAISDVINSVMSDGAQHQELCDLGKAHAAKFSWEDSARKTIEVYESLLA